MAWWQNRITVPYGSPDYDKAMGGSHDMDFAEQPNTPITAIVGGTVVSEDSPAWGRQVGIQMDRPIGNVPYMSFLHLAAINPQLKPGMHVNPGDLIGWSGGANTQAQYAGTSNPTGSNFTNSSFQSGQPQVGVALMYGPAYGEGPAWNASSPPENHPELNPQLLFGQGLGLQTQGGGPSPLVTYVSGTPTSLSLPGGFQLPGITTDVLYRIGVGAIGVLLLYLAVKHFTSSPEVVVN